jgi:hypothetical protein
MGGADLISVGTFVRHNSVWLQIAPTMDSVVRASNTAQVSLGAAVPSRSAPERNALIAETAFLLAGSGFAGGSYERSQLEEKAREFLLGLPRSSGAEAELSSDEWLEVGLLARVTQRYTATLEEVVFSPAIPGCGVVDAAIGDVLSGSELIEIKTVTRPFRTYDIRQALTYVAMLYSAGHIIERVTLLNPRRARVVTMPVGEIAAGMRGDSAVELLQDLITSMMDLQVSA